MLLKLEKTLCWAAHILVPQVEWNIRILCCAFVQGVLIIDIVDRDILTHQVGLFV